MRNYDYFLHAVKNKLCVEDMLVDLDEDLFQLGSFKRIFKKFDATALKILSNAIASGDCKSGLTIDLRGNAGGDKSVRELIQCLKSKKRPEKLTFLLGGNGLTNKCMEYISDTLLKSFQVSGLTFDLNGYSVFNESDVNHFDDKGAIILAHCLRRLFENNNCQPDLKIILAQTSIGNLGANAIAEALEVGIRTTSSKQTITLELPSRIDVNLLARIKKNLEILNNRGVGLQNNSSVLFANSGPADARKIEPVVRQEHRI